MTRSQQMLGYDSNYVPGWDCHGLPIEWKIEERIPRQGQEQGRRCRSTNSAANAAPSPQHWIDVQREEFKRLGVEGDWDHPYTTMDFAAEAQIAREMMKFAANGTLYRGSKPVMWSVVEKTALAEAEVEYEDYTSDTVWVKFPVIGGPAELAGASVVIWTTTPWTLPGNRAISFSSKISYGLYEVKDAPMGNWANPGDKFLLADPLALDVMKQARVLAYERRAAVDGADAGETRLRASVARCHSRLWLRRAAARRRSRHRRHRHRLRAHRARPWPRRLRHLDGATRRQLAARGINTAIPYTVDENGAFTAQAPGFAGKRVLNDKGEKGDANEAVIKALIEAKNIIARGRLKHQYPHSWRSKKPVIYRNTPQWFIAMDKDSSICRHCRRIAAEATSRRTISAPCASARSTPSPKRAGCRQQGQNRITGMIESKPDWVISRQRAWGVPITVFVRGDCRRRRAKSCTDEAVNARIAEAFEKEGADAWYAAGARERFLGDRSPTRAGRRSTTFSTSGSIPARPMRSCWKTPSISRRSPASSASATAATIR